MIEANSEDVDAHNSKGWAHAKLNQHDKAIKCFGKAYEMSPDNPLYMFNLANSYMMLGESQKAKELFQKGLKIVEGAKEEELKEKYQLLQENVKYLKKVIR